MPVKETPKAEAPGPAPAEADNDPLTEPGFHVLGNGNYCGTFVDHEQAQAYVDGHLVPQDISAEIVEGPAAVVE